MYGHTVCVCACAHVCVCACAHVCVCTCMSVCVGGGGGGGGGGGRERERERLTDWTLLCKDKGLERERQTNRQTNRDRKKNMYACMHVWTHVCVYMYNFLSSHNEVSDMNYKPTWTWSTWSIKQSSTSNLSSSNSSVLFSSFFSVLNESQQYTRRLFLNFNIPWKFYSEGEERRKKTGSQFQSQKRTDLES